MDSTDGKLSHAFELLAYLRFTIMSPIVYSHVTFYPKCRIIVI
jgi:hypothetical protein